MTDLEKINKIVGAFKDVTPGSIIHVTIKHDADCPAIRTKSLSDCRCEPEIITTGENENGKTIFQ